MGQWALIVFDFLAAQAAPHTISLTLRIFSGRPQRTPKKFEDVRRLKNCYELGNFFQWFLNTVWGKKKFYPTLTSKTAAFVTCWALRKWWNAAHCSNNSKSKTILLSRLWFFEKVRNRVLLPGVCGMQS